MAKLKIPRQIGQVVKDRRIAMGITQSQLAELSNTSRSLVYRVEKGATNGVAFDKLFDVLKALQLELAVMDANANSKNNQRIPAKAEDGHNEDTSRDKLPLQPHVPGRKVNSKGGSSQSAETQYEKELKAARNIKDFNVLRSLEE